MWLPDESLSVRGARCTALLSRRVLGGIHLYPTASLRIPVSAHDSALWRIRIVKMKHGLAVGVKSPALERGRVFGRPVSVGLVWWLSNEGCVYNGSNEVPLFHNDPTWSESLAGAGESQGSSVWRFRAGDIVQIKLEQAQVSFCVNNRSWSHPASVAPMAAGKIRMHKRAHIIDNAHHCIPSVTIGICQSRAALRQQAMYSAMGWRSLNVLCRC